MIAVVLLSEGASWNANVVRIGPAPFCPYLKDGILAGGGVLALVATALGVTSFVLLRSQPAAGAPNGQQPAGIAIGHPQQYPPAAKPSEQPPAVASGQAHQPPSRPQVVPTVSHAQGYVHTPQMATPEFASHPPQGYGSHHAPTNQQFAPHLPQGLPANTAPLAATAAAQSFAPPPQVAYAQPQQLPSYSPQYSPAVQPQAAYGQVPAVPPVVPSQGCDGGQTTGISTEGLLTAGAKLLMRVAEHSLSSHDNIANADPAATPEDTTFEPSTGDSTTQNAAQDANYYA